jgi:hypothetical protein
MTTGLTFNTLRAANAARLPLFTNRHGQPAHSQPDGSDWSPAMWFTALLGELGELAETRVLYDNGTIDFDTYRNRVQAEAADVVTYLDIFCRRCLDSTYGAEQPADGPQQLLQVTMELGRYANALKKHIRGDYTSDEFQRETHGLLHSVMEGCVSLNSITRDVIGTFHTVSMAHPSGVNLGDATLFKFNEVSKRVNCGVFIQSQGDRFVRPAGSAE